MAHAPPSSSPPTGPTALRYMTAFRCLAERCEDSCCHGLAIPVSQAHAQRIQSLLAQAPQAPALQALDPQALFALEPGAPPEQHALIHVRPDGFCPLISSERLCSLQRQYGEQVLPDICATFPRIVLRRGEHLEVSGTLACPEVARLCLLQEDALEPVAAESALVPRPETALALPEHSAEAQAFALALRSSALRLLQQRDYPLASRLSFLAHWASRLEPLLAEQLGSSGPAAAHAVLEAERERFESPEHLASLHQNFSALALPGGHSLGLYASVLRARLEAARSERFTSWAHAVLASLGLEDSRQEHLAPAWHTLTTRREQLERHHGERLHQYFLHAGANQLWREPPAPPPGLLASVFRLVLRLGLQRVALLGHPQVAALCAQPSPAPQARAQLDAAAVESFQLSAKYLERSPEVLTLAQSLARASSQEVLGRALVLASFFRAAPA